MTFCEANPDIDWYMSLSKERGVTPRCPFASVDRCPRYYQSSSLLGHAGFSEISAADGKRLSSFWEKSDLWPRTNEMSSSIRGVNQRYTSFSQFCPEVSYGGFGLFASGLYEYADEIDRDLAHKRLSEIRAARDNWKWRWASISALHFTECSLYSPLMYTPALSKEGAQEALTLKPTFWGITVDLKVLWKRCRNWFLQGGEKSS